MSLNKQEVYDIIEEHYRKNFKMLTNKYGRYAWSQANGEDIVQEAYLRAMTYWDSYNISQDFTKWFNQILVNCLRDKISEDKSKGFVTDLNVDIETPARAFNKLLVNDIIKIIQKKKENIKTILLLYFFENYKTIDISKIVKESHANVRRTIFTFRKDLRELFDVRIFEKEK